MKLFEFIMLSSVVTIFFVYPTFANEEKLAEPEIVHLASVSINGKIKTLKVFNSKGYYILTCNIGASRSDPDFNTPDNPATMCETPVAGNDYWVFNDKTIWKLPNATKAADLAFFEDWSVKYEGENIALVPKNSEGLWGIYQLKYWKQIN